MNWQYHVMVILLPQNNYILFSPLLLILHFFPPNCSKLCDSETDANLASLCSVWQSPSGHVRAK